MKLKTPKILYFVAGYAPTAADLIVALDLGVGVQYRNSTKINAEDPCEPCDGVAGDVPAQYAEKFPDATEVVEAYREGLTAARERMGETGAVREPVRTKATGAKAAPAKTAAAKAAAAPAKPAWGAKAAAGATPTPAPTTTEGGEGGEGGQGDGPVAGEGGEGGDSDNTSE